MPIICEYNDIFNNVKIIMNKCISTVLKFACHYI